MATLGSMVLRLSSVSAQHRGVARLGFIDDHASTSSLQGSLPAYPFLRAFILQLREFHFVEGENLEIERASAEGSPERIESVVRAMTNRPLDVIVTNTSSVTEVARRAAVHTPIVMIAEGDPVASGWAQSLARPGSNLTGISSDTGATLNGKRLQILKDLIPRLGRVGVVRPHDRPGSALWSAELDNAASKNGLSLQPYWLDAPNAIADVFSNIVRDKPDAILVTDALTSRGLAGTITNFSKAQGFALMCPRRWWAEGGALVSYGPDSLGMARQAAGHVAKVLNGAKPGDVPIEQPSIFELVINTRTASDLGLQLPPSLRLQADELL